MEAGEVLIPAARSAPPWRASSSERGEEEEEDEGGRSRTTATARTASPAYPVYFFLRLQFSVKYFYVPSFPQASASAWTSARLAPTATVRRGTTARTRTLARYGVE